MKKKQANTTPDSLPSLADSSFASSVDESNNNSGGQQQGGRTLVFKTPHNKILLPGSTSQKTLIQSISSPVVTITSTADTEVLSVGSPEANSPSSLHQQKAAFRTSECVNINPVFVSPASTYVDGKPIDGFYMNTNRENPSAEYSASGDESYMSSFCTDSFLIRSPNLSGGVFHMFDISPQLWPGWSLVSPFQETPQKTDEDDKKQGEKSHNIPKMGTPLHNNRSNIVSTPHVVIPKKIVYYGGYSPSDYSPVDPVIEASATPPRFRSRDSSYHEHSRRQLIRQFDEHVTPPAKSRNSSPSSNTATESSGETVVTRNVVNEDNHSIVNANNSNWEHKVAELERTCETLNEIIRADSKAMLQLKADIETLVTPNGSTTNTDSNEIDNLPQQVSEMLTQDPVANTAYDELHSPAPSDELRATKPLNYACLLEIERLKLENQLLSKQVAASEHSSRYLETIVSALTKENTILRNRIQEISRQEIARSTKGTPVTASTEATSVDVDVSLLEPEALRRQVEALASRISAIEKNGGIQRATTCLLDDEEEEIIAISKSLGTQDASQYNGQSDLNKTNSANIEVWKHRNDATCEEDDDEVEVTLQGMIITTTSSSPNFGINQSKSDELSTSSKGSNKENLRPDGATQNQEKIHSKKNKGWTSLCGCFPFSSSQEEVSV